jgi:hypothetical protein
VNPYENGSSPFDFALSERSGTFSIRASRAVSICTFFVHCATSLCNAIMRFGVARALVPAGQPQRTVQALSPDKWSIC